MKHNNWVDLSTLIRAAAALAVGLTGLITAACTCLAPKGGRRSRH